MSNSTHENIERLLRLIRDNLSDCELHHNTQTVKNDHANLENAILAALIEANRIEPEHLEEIKDVKPLHDRIHSIVLALRVSRNNLERLEHFAELALEHAREVAHTVEEPYDDHEL
jgi:ATP-dependent RNA circularization protein (DNA/RNA ligase family)